VKIKNLTYGLATVFGLIGPALFLRNINLSDWGMLLVELGFALWLLSPFVLIALAVRSDRFSAIGALIATILAGLFGAWFYTELTFHFYTRSDAQDAIAMLFVAAYQHAIIVLTLGLASIVGWLQTRRK
jgi:TRAP-type C4-dicarboxylate transport system permease large subunit